ncbi:hypothetical protein SBA5_680013 [Candidatus Sulfotelmatomonas gaucii]|uniref:Uncharacterized protein n=1 Tax=Candidatus Sulfuritelmatomonas gaucii TaxID=2043161 RepID=A0A2N9LZJ8_9BACT|nr:hypothetical protein SBA5_680013 [Candidatus Sulfotelmatomonas gaucii]
MAMYPTWKTKSAQLTTPEANKGAGISSPAGALPEASDRSPKCGSKWQRVDARLPPAQRSWNCK